MQLSLKILSELANSVDTDQTAPLNRLFLQQQFYLGVVVFFARNFCVRNFRTFILFC